MVQVYDRQPASFCKTKQKEGNGTAELASSHHINGAFLKGLKSHIMKKALF
jgi:hypothetical protein